MIKMTKQQVEEKLKQAQDERWQGLKNSTIYFWEPHYDGISGKLRISNASEWDFEEMELVSRYLGTKDINIIGNGCETCGYGAAISVGGIEIIDEIEL